MLFTVGLITSFLLAPAVLAYPYQDENRIPYLLTRDNDLTVRLAGVEYWGDGNATFTSIDATFNVPHVTHLKHPFSIKIGLDNIHCRDAYIHAGVEITPDHDGKASYRGYFLWHPSKKGYFEHLSISAGHDVTFSIQVALTPTTSAVIIAKDEHTGTSDAVLLSAPSANAICAKDAVLLVEPHNHHKPIANFSTVAFKNVHLSAINEYVLHLDDLEQNYEMKARTVEQFGSFVVNYV